MKLGPESRFRPWWQKLAWLVLIWFASVTALGAVAWLIRLLMNAAGLTAD